MKVSIVMPAYNEERRIGRTLEKYCSFFDSLVSKGFDYQILVVINNTKDRTEEVVKNYQKKFKKLQYLRFKEGGKGFAITEGFKESLKEDFDLIGFVDADMATSPEAYYDLIKNIDGWDGVIASRWMKESKVRKQTLSRIIMSRGFNFLVRVLFLFNYRDTQCGAKVFRKKVLLNIVNDLKLTQWAYDINLLYLCKKNNFKINEIPTIWEDKKESKVDFFRTPIQMFLGVVRLRLIYSIFERILRPIKFILRFGDKLVNKK